MTSSPLILLIDDDRSLVDVLSMALEDAGFMVATAHDGMRGLESFRQKEPNLIVLDLLMPELDGLEVCKRIRKTHRTPIIMLTSRDEEMDKVLGLELGADDYVTKPFSTRELVARIRAALRRVAMQAPAQEAENRRQRGPLRLDRDTREVSLHDQPMELTATELTLLVSWIPALTLLWSATAALLWLSGRAHPGLRVASILLIVAALTKLLAFDWAHLDGVSRITLLMVVGTTLLVTPLFSLEKAATTDTVSLP